MRRRQLLLFAATAAFTEVGRTRDADRSDGRCVRLEQRIAELRLKLRMGYTASQGRVYRQKLSALLKEQRATCH